MRDVVIVEATWLGYFEPYSESYINSYIYEMMIATGQEAMASEYDLTPFKVQVLDPRRTICEKIMSLVRFSYADDPISDLSKKVRHTYDLHQLLQQEELKVFLYSDDFYCMLLRVAQDDVASFKNNNAWLKYHPSECMFFAELELVWENLTKVYEQSFRGLVYGDFPNGTLVLDTMKLIRERVRGINWDIKIEQ